ncbi:MAG: hypothetical protein COT18_11980, partial [Elusimicrobia bacterium CG08_land_8_20_14_0_20_59_10]
ASMSATGVMMASKFVGDGIFITPVGAALQAGYIWVGDSTNKAAEVGVSGDISLSTAGVAAIGTGKVTNLMLAGSIEDGKLNQLTSANKVALSALEAGTLAADVVASSVGANGVRPGSIEAGAIVNADIGTAAAIAISKLATTGALGANVIVSSIAVNAVYAGALAANAVTTAKIADGTIIAADIAVSTISLDKLNQSGCSGGQIAKWNGSAWACAEDNNTPVSYTADEESLHLEGGSVFSAKASSVTLRGNTFNGISQLVLLDSSGYLPALNGSLLTSLTPANMANGTLGAGVITSSVGTNGVRPGSIEAGAIVDADINAAAAIAIGKLATTGTLGAAVIVSSIAVNAVHTAAIADNAVTTAKIADGAIIT